MRGPATPAVAKGSCVALHVRISRMVAAGRWGRTWTPRSSASTTNGAPCSASAWPRRGSSRTTVNSLSRRLRRRAGSRRVRSGTCGRSWATCRRHARIPRPVVGAHFEPGTSNACARSCLLAAARGTQLANCYSACRLAGQRASVTADGATPAPSFSRLSEQWLTLGMARP